MKLGISGTLVTVALANSRSDAPLTRRCSLPFFRVTSRDSIQLHRPATSMFVATGMFLFLLTLSQYLELFAKHAHIESRQMADQPRVRDESLASQKRRQ
jgi:hypothetical protein